jgi:hypothetical protein
MPHRIIIGVVVAIGLGVLPASAQNSTTTSNRAKGDPRLITVTGCLERGTSADAFLLTKVPDPLVDSVAAAGGGAIPTVTYQLSGGQNLAAHLGHKIQVTGRGPLKAQTPVKVTDTEKTYPAGASGGSNAQGKAEVKEKAAVALRPLAVQSFKMVSADCAAK